MRVLINKFINRDEDGQVLIQVAIMMVVLLGFAALAIDAGNVYAERRRMQNAADAGALAGARELCLLGDEDVAIAKASEYMQRNGVAAADIGAGDITVDGNVIDTTARETADMFLAGLLGFNTIDVQAEAAAACGAATTGCGLWPIAFDQTLWEEIYDEGDGCGKEFVVWNDNTGGGGGGGGGPTSDFLCVIDDEVHTNACDCYDCDLNDDGEDDFIVLDGQGRAWLDYSGAADPFTDPCTAPGCGASELACHIRNDSGAQISLPQCVPGDNGVKAGVKDDVNSRAGDNVNIALYDGSCSGGDCDTGTAFQVTSFGCVTVVGWEQNFTLEPLTEDYRTQRGKVVKVRMNCNGDCVTFCGSTDGTPPEPWQLKAVSLTK